MQITEQESDKGQITQIESENSWLKFCHKSISEPIMVAQGKFVADCLKLYKVAFDTEEPPILSNGHG